MKSYSFMLGLLLWVVSARAQGNLGNYYQNLYLQTHLAADLGKMAGSGSGSRPTTGQGTLRWNTNPAQSALVRQLTASAQPQQRTEVRTTLTKLLQTVPVMVAEVKKQTGVAVAANNSADLMSICGVLAYQELTGKSLTDAQFANQVKNTRSNLIRRGLSAAAAQATGEKYSIALAWMAVLKAAGQPQALRTYAEQVFRLAYGRDYTNYHITEEGISS